MASRRTTGTVTWWRPEEGGGLIDAPGLPGSCWADTAAVDSPGTTVLRAGQVVDLEWESQEERGYPCRAVRVSARDQLQATPGG